VLQVPLGEVQETKAAMGNNRGIPSAFQRGKAERLLPMTPALGEGSERAQGSRQPRLGPEPHVCIGHAGLPVRSPYVPPQQHDRPTEVADGVVGLPQAMGCLLLQSAIAKL
jgi:hypothetical protein